jgi:S1-C subfamily serine protease
MKKLLLAIVLVIGLCGVAWSSQIFTTTIQNTTIQQVQDVSLEYMMGKNFAVDRVDDYTITFTKGFGDGFWIASRNMTIKFNMLQRSDNVKLMVTQFEDSPQAFRKGQRSIEHLIPLIKDIRHTIDGTPLNEIANEVIDQQADLTNKSPQTIQTSGLIFNFDELRVSSVESGSLAEKAGLQPGDIIVEVNASPADEKILKDIDARLSSGRSVVIVYEREGKKDMATLKIVR